MKGMSPFIAVVLIIAITISVGIIISRWSSTFVQEQTEEVGERSSCKIKCEGNAALRIDDGKLNTTSNITSVVAENTGTLSLRNFTFNILLENGTSLVIDVSPADVTLTPGQKQTFSTNLSVANDADNITTARLLSKCDDCDITVHDSIQGNELSEIT